MVRRHARPAFAVAVACALAGCGTTAHITRTITRTAPASGSTASTSTRPATTSRSAAPPRPALTGRSPRAILDAAAGALRNSLGYALRANLLQGGRRTLIVLTTSGARTVDATLTTEGTVTEVISLPGASYLRGNAAFWRDQARKSAAARSRAGALANHWLRVPAADARSITRSLGTLAPGTLDRCLTEDHGTLSIAGHTTIEHTRAVIVRDAGNAPGATPSTIDVAATGAPYPLRYVATGPTRSGGAIDICNDGKGGGAEGTITLDRFGQVPPIQPPAGAQEQSGGSAT